MQVRKMSNEKYMNSFVELQTTQNMVLPIIQQVMVSIQGEVIYAPTNGAVEATPAFGRQDSLLVSPPLVTFTEGKNEATGCQFRQSHIHTR